MKVWKLVKYSFAILSFISNENPSKNLNIYIMKGKLLSASFLTFCMLWQIVWWSTGERGGGGKKSATQQMLSKYMQTQKDRLIKLAVHIAYIHLLILSQQREYMTTSMFMLCRSSSNLLTYYLILLPLLHPLHVWRQNAFHVFPTSWSAMKGS